MSEIEVQEWPLKKDGDEQFFGYVVAIGILPKNWQHMEPYVDFAYNDKLSRFKLPYNDGLIDELFDYLRININESIRYDGMSGKVWIKVKDGKYIVSEP